MKWVMWPVMDGEIDGFNKAYLMMQKETEV